MAKDTLDSLMNLSENELFGRFCVEYVYRHGIKKVDAMIYTTLLEQFKKFGRYSTIQYMLDERR